MQPHQQRVVDELYDLDLKIGKLSQFLMSEIGNQIPELDRNLLKQQRFVMRAYRDILRERINNFKV